MPPIFERYNRQQLSLSNTPAPESGKRTTSGPCNKTMKRTMQMNATDKIMKALEEACKRGAWGQITIDLQRGTPVVIRTIDVQKLHEEDNSHAKYTAPQQRQ